MAGKRGAGPVVAAGEARIAVVAAGWHAALVDQLIEGARRALASAGVREANLEVHRVPGAWELPAAALWLAESGRLDAVLAFGCVIRGDTPHFGFVAGECARGLMQVQIVTGVPVAFGVLTVEDEAQAAERADPARMDKGGEAARAALEMVMLKQGLEDR
jgi:6,7-dimethyl-8-ribityllumazine synthase